ncbi:MAG: immunoglobulin domain-containing protein [Verrucomicrobia bacterium]|nr:immunoglobulin domain-containing protein [Verrucomicrobiota bacterium]
MTTGRVHGKQWSVGRGLLLALTRLLILAGALALRSNESPLAQLHPGALDPSFDPGAGANGPIYGTLLQQDGRIMVWGAFTSFNGVPRNYLARLHSDGRLDPAFDPRPGIVVSPNSPFNQVRTVAIQQDGKILIGGWITNYNGLRVSNVFRLHADGSVDASFTANPPIDTPVNALALLEDGMVLVGTRRPFTAGGPHTGLLRLRQDGRRDAALSPIFIDEISVIHRATDGSLLLAGNILPNTRSFIGVNLARLSPDGTADSNFLAQLPRLSGISTIQMQSNGGILVNNTAYGVQPIVRLDRDGRMDSNFVVQVAGIRTIRMDTQDRVIVGGSFRFVNDQLRPTVARLLSNGELDFSFHTGRGCEGGLDVFGPAVYSMAVQPDGRILIAGSFISADGQSRRGIARLQGGSLENAPPTIFVPPTNQTVREGQNATLTASVASTGRPSFQWKFNGLDLFGATNETLRVPRPRLADAGAYTVIANNSFGARTSAVATLTVVPKPVQPGAVDLSFTSGLGIAGDWNASVRSVLELPDSKLLVTGFFTNFNGQLRHGITRLNSDGSNDPSWLDALVEGEVRAAVRLENGKMVIAGYFKLPGATNWAGVARLNADGTVDPSFSAIPGPDGYHAKGIYALTLLPDGKLLAGGAGPYTLPWDPFSPQPAPLNRGVARLMPNGELDATFNAGWGAANPGSAFNLINAVGVDQAGKFIIGGRFNYFNRKQTGALVRLNPDGSLDSTFNPMINGFVSDLVALPDGKVLASGVASSGSGTASPFLTRLLSDGSFDGGFWVEFKSDVGRVEDLRFALQPDGAVIAAGPFNYVNGIPCSTVARLNPDGTFDPNFNPGLGLLRNSGGVGALTVLRDDSILLGGSFDSFDGLSARSLVRLYGGDLTTGRPVITVPPASRVVQAGTNLSLVVSVASASAPSYQWLHDGQTIPGATNPVLRFENVLLKNSGRYSVRVQDGFGTVASAEASLEVLPVSRDPGALDPEFFTRGGPDQPVRAGVLQENDQILIGGSFQKYDGKPRNYLARINADGSLDETFSERSAPDGPVHFIQRLAKGQFLIAGAFTNIGAVRYEGIARLNRDGNVDTTFTNSFPRGRVLALQPDGKAILKTTNGLERANADGTIDANFKTRELLGRFIDVRAAAVQLDGRILMGGGFDFAVRTRQVKSLARLNADGSLDESFAYEPLWNSRVPVEALTVRDDGNILIAPGLALVRCDGVLIRQIQPVASSSAAQVYCLVDHHDGRLTLGGSFGIPSWNSRSNVVRIFLGNDSPAAPVITVQPIDQDPLAGQTVNFSVTVSASVCPQFQWQFNGTNLPRETNRGLTLRDVRPANSGNYAVQIEAAGMTLKSREAQLRVAPPEVHPGATDLEFRFEGQLGDGGFGLAQSGGYYYASGNRYTPEGVRPHLIFTRADGSIDETFSLQAIFGTDAPTSAHFRCIAVQPDGKVLIGGVFSSINGLKVGGVFRLSSERILDPTFVPGTGPALRNFGCCPGVWTLLPLRSGQILAGGDFNLFCGRPKTALVRLNSDGSLDESLAIEPSLNTKDPNQRPIIAALVSEEAGGFYAAGTFDTIGGQPRNHLAHILSNGIVDPRFVPEVSGAGSISSVIRQPDGRLLISGPIFSIRDRFPPMARLMPDGSRDRSFALQSKVALDYFRLLALQRSGMIIGSVANALIRFFPDGKQDETFQTTVQGVAVVALVLENDDLLIAGNFSHVNGISSQGLARVHGGAPGVLRLMSGGVEKGQIVLYAQPPVGQRYALEFKNSVLEPSWRLLTNQVGDGALQRLVDSLPASSERYYRLRLE